MVPSEAGRAIDRLRKPHRRCRAPGFAVGVFSIFVYEALQDKLANVDLRLLLHNQSLEQFPLNGREAENLKRARLDQHRVARAFVAWAKSTFMRER